MAEAQAMTASSVMILGMHRSGTSLVAGSLEAAGLYLGEVNTKAPFNKKGNRENENIRTLNETLLARVGATWKVPPQAQVSWSPEDIRTGRDLIEPYINSGRSWGFKDPRTVWTLEGWLHILSNPRIVAVVRHPALVAKSLASRPGSLHVSYDAGLALWQAYNTELLRLSRELHFPILHFSTEPKEEDEFVTRLELVRRDLGLPRACDGFYAAELVHQREFENAIPVPLQDLFDHLCEAASNPFEWQD